MSRRLYNRNLICLSIEIPAITKRVYLSGFEYFFIFRIIGTKYTGEV